MAVIGVSEGYDRFLWRHWDTSYFDIDPKVMHGLNVQPCDVRVAAALDAALAGKAGVLFDTAVAGSGSHSYSKEKAQVECGYAKNLSIYEAQSEGLLRHRPGWFAMKIFLPPMDVNYVPSWLQNLWGVYEVRIIKPGVLHSDEFFIVGRKSSIGVDFNRRLYEMGILRVTVMVDAGNIAAMSNLAAGDYEPFFAPENARAQDTLVSEDYPVVRASGGVIEKEKLLPGTFKTGVSADEFARMLDQAAGVPAPESSAPPKTPEATSKPQSAAPTVGGGAPKFTGAQLIPHDPADIAMVRYFLVPKSLTPEEREKVEEIRDSGSQDEHDRFVRVQQSVFAARGGQTFKSLVRCASGNLLATDADWEAYRYFEKTEDVVLKMFLASAQMRAKHITLSSGSGTPGTPGTPSLPADH